MMNQCLKRWPFLPTHRGNGRMLQERTKGWRLEESFVPANPRSQTLVEISIRPALTLEDSSPMRNLEGPSVSEILPALSNTVMGDDG